MAAFEAVLFDCDGVLVDSEPITNRVQREVLAELGWELTEAEGIARFVGHAFADFAPDIHEATGVWIDEAWLEGFRARRDAALRAELRPVPGAADAVRAIADALGGRVACASGADRAKTQMQVDIAGLSDVFGDRIFSGMECVLTKPAPDVYLAAAAALGVDPAACAVIEDSAAGVSAGLAAGATVFGFAPQGPTHQLPEALLAQGAAATFSAMADLPALVLGGRPRA
ncbi:HAD family phosphatase [Propioniciclava coleopterorum]|uniref:HAD family phosphatase n=1 Tax=Propioniciclava coleopterorum TaxID=2714937 RepID=A0A6G7Y7T7_9ACTN|nr:HAD family phosphatase [Propioniciclava coleopterorum]QIK72779.1 HAD family phosphatase [Propioniciclava coleopterorum]